MQNQPQLSTASPIMIETTQDGSPTLYLPEIQEHYHSTFGAIEESMHIYIGLGLDSLPGQKSVHILEVGLGTALNALLSYRYGKEHGLYISYTSYERYPLGDRITDLLNYDDSYDEIFREMHACQWGQPVAIGPLFDLHKIEADFNQAVLQKQYDLVYYDAFAPDKQEEMWSEDNFKKIFDSLRPAGVLVTYCSKGAVRRALQGVGFEVTKHPGPTGKREVLRAIKPML